MQIHHYIRIFTVQVCIFHTCINFILQRNQAVGCLIRKSWPVSKIPAQVLTLINGDRISMPPMVRLLFEVADLAQASPATVSRAGMATKQHWFLNIDGNLGWYKLILLFGFLDHLMKCILRWPFKNNLGGCGNVVVTSHLFDRVPLQFRCWREYNSCKDWKLDDIFVICFGRLSPEWANRGVLRSTRPGMGTILQVMGGEVHPYQPAAGCYLVFNAALGNLKTRKIDRKSNRCYEVYPFHLIPSPKRFSTNYVGYQGTIIIYNYTIVLYSILYI